MKSVLCLSMVVALSVAASAHAQDHARRHEQGGHAQGNGHAAPAPRGGDGRHGEGGMRAPPRAVHPFPGEFRRFAPDDRARWIGGGWRHAYHGGRWGWWWVVDGFWYWYDAPVYPYPLVVSPVIDDPLPPPDVVEDAGEPGAPPPRFRYFCPDRGYYPYIQSCPTDFVREPIPDRDDDAP